MRAHIIAPVLLACPSFKPAWDAHLADWGPNEPGIYNDLAVLAQHIVNLAAARQTAEFPALFSIFEDLISSSDPELVKVVSFGLIEDLQTIATHHPGTGHEIFGALQPRSQQAWQAVAKSWDGETSLADVIRGEMRGSGPGDGAA